MIYPDNFEAKIGFSEVRKLIASHCLSTLGKEQVGKMEFSTDAILLNRRMEEIREFRHILHGRDDFPAANFYDMRQAVKRVRLEGTHLEEEELFNLRRVLGAVTDVVRFLSGTDDDSDDAEATKTYPALYALADGVATFPKLINRIDQVIDKDGHMRDNASPELLRIRQELARTEGSISRTLYGILHAAQRDGLVAQDVTPSVRDGRLVIPVAPAMKRKLSGIVHDESATGKTIFIEPTEVVEANNRIRELENEERREIIRILTEVSKVVRPNVAAILDSLDFLAQIDFIRAKAIAAEDIDAYEPEINAEPCIDWIEAYSPALLLRHGNAQMERSSIVPLDIILTPKNRILIISGPNAGGKSVCLKTTGLVQYMLQCGMSIPVSPRSKAGVFSGIMIDIGDEQSIENDLSTYSSHLLNMKQMMKQSNDRTLLLIDEFGTGTEPQIGGAIAEAVLVEFCKRKAWGVITTHYQNLKHFADSHDGVVNGAMLYDRALMRPLFQLAIGRPGSSFAIDIARKIGLSEEVIRYASDIVGSDYIQSDKYLQDIVRDKRYWEQKRQKIHQLEKDLEIQINRYETGLEDIEKQRRQIVARAKEEAEELLRESNKKIENAIREIRESQAEKEETKKIREELGQFRQEVENIDTSADDERIARKIQEIQGRKERKARRKAEKQKQKATAGTIKPKLTEQPLDKGDTVKMKGTQTVGTIEAVDGKMAIVVFGTMRTRVPVSRLERAEPVADKPQGYAGGNNSMMTREVIDEHRKAFNPELDVRGMRGNEALTQVQYFIDDAIMAGASQLRILHGKGNGILRQLIRQYLATVPNVKSFRDEHVQFGGAGITVVEL